MVEEKDKVVADRKHLLTLSLYFQEFPLCCCWNTHGASMLNIMLRRMKYLFTSCDLCAYTAHQVFIKPWSCIAWGIVIVVGINVCIIALPIWYLANDTMFKENKIAFGYDSNCHYPHKGGVFCDNDPIWIVNTFGRTFFWALLALIVLHCLFIGIIINYIGIIIYYVNFIFECLYIGKQYGNYQIPSIVDIIHSETSETFSESFFSVNHCSLFLHQTALQLIVN